MFAGMGPENWFWFKYLTLSSTSDQWEATSNDCQSSVLYDWWDLVQSLKIGECPKVWRNSASYLVAVQVPFGQTHCRTLSKVSESLSCELKKYSPIEQLFQRAVTYKDWSWVSELRFDGMVPENWLPDRTLSWANRRSTTFHRKNGSE